MGGGVLDNLKGLFIRYGLGPPPCLLAFPSWSLAIHLFNEEVGLKDPEGCFLLLKVTCHLPG